MRKTSASSGFTLIELLVVIAIIVLLIGILVPAIAAARIQAWKVATETQLAGLDAAIRKYSQDFNGALPGQYPQLTGAAGAQTVTSKLAGSLATSDAKISGTQNLLLAMSYCLSPTAAGGNYVQIPGTNTMGTATNANCVSFPSSIAPTVDITLANGPKDFTVTTTATENKQFSPYYSPTKDDLKTCTGSFTLTDQAYAWNSSGTYNAFPVIVDRYGDPMPILYFRRDAATGPWAAENKSTSASYYREENSEYLDGIVYAANGVPYNQGTKSNYNKNNGTAATNLGDAIMASVGGTVAGSSSFSSRGDYVLLSAGPDRIYGAVTGNTNPSPKPPSDDQMHVTSGR